MSPDALRAEYAENGFVLLRNAISRDAMDRVETAFLDWVQEISGRRFSNFSDPDMAEWLSNDRRMEQTLYEGVRDFSWLLDISIDETITDHIKTLLGPEVGVLEKIPFRIDLPMVMRELAVWHQDFFYVGGNEDTITAWIPMQDTPYEVGCLLAMPGSHRMGVVPHDKPLLQKKKVPSTIFDRPVRYLEMKRGDLLLFSALLLHSSGNNISERIRFSIQSRYSRLSQETDPGMGKLIPVG